MLIDRTAPLVCDARKAFQVSCAVVALIRRSRNGPHLAGVQRVDIPRPERSICTATTVAPNRVSASVRVGESLLLQRPIRGCRERDRVAVGVDAVGDLVPAPPDDECRAVFRDRSVLSRRHIGRAFHAGAPGFARAVDDGHTGSGATPPRRGDDDVAVACCGSRQVWGQALRNRIADQHDRPRDAADGRTSAWLDEAAVDQEQRTERERHGDECATRDEETRNGAVPDRRLDEVVRQRCQRDGQDREDERAQRHAQPGQIEPAVPFGPHLERPVPQVHPV